MSFNLLLALLFALILAIFAAQNAKPVVIQFLGWEWITSLVVVIVGSAALGALLVGTLSLVRQVGMRMQVRDRQNRLRQAEQQLEQAQRRLAEQEQEITRLQGELAAARRLSDTAAGGGPAADPTPEPGDPTRSAGLA